MTLIRTWAVVAIIIATIVSHTTFEPERLTRPHIIQGNPVPITFVVTEDCPDITHCDN